jgi:hypothetical protein
MTLVTGYYLSKCIKFTTAVHTIKDFDANMLSKTRGKFKTNAATGAV